jgi:hypothetical protein
VEINVHRLSVSGSSSLEDISPGGILLVPNPIKKALTLRIHLHATFCVCVYEPRTVINSQEQKKWIKKSERERYEVSLGLTRDQFQTPESNQTSLAANPAIVSYNAGAVKKSLRHEQPFFKAKNISFFFEKNAPAYYNASNKLVKSCVLAFG